MKLKLLDWSRSRGALLLRAVLIGTFALLAILVYEAVREARSHVATAEHALREYAGFAAWRFIAGWDARMYTAVVPRFAPLHQAAAGSGNHLPPLERFGDEAERIRGCRCLLVLPTSFHFRADLATGTMDVLGSATASDRAALRRMTGEILREHQVRSDAFRVRYAALPSGRAAIVSTVFRGRAGTPRAVYGFVAPATPFVTTVADAVLQHHSLFPESIHRGLPLDSLATVELIGADDALLFSSGPARGGAYGRTEPLAVSMGGGRLRVTLHPGAVRGMLVGDQPGARLYALLGGIGLAIVLGGIALWLLGREHELTRLRADVTSSVSHELRTPLA